MAVASSTPATAAMPASMKLLPTNAGRREPMGKPVRAARSDQARWISRPAGSKNPSSTGAAQAANASAAAVPESRCGGGRLPKPLA